MKKIFLSCICMLLLLITSCSSAGKQELSPQPGTAEWDNLSHAKKIAVYQELSEEELKRASRESLQELILSCPLLEEVYYYLPSEEDPNGTYATAGFSVGISLLADEIPLFKKAIEENVFQENSSEMQEFVESYQMWVQDTNATLLSSAVLEPYRDILDFEWKRDAQTSRYFYPLDTESDAWSLLTASGKRAVCDVPQRVLDDISDEELIDLLLRYPMLNDVYFYANNEFHYGVERLAEYFEPMRIVHEKRLLIPYVEEHWEKVKDQYDDFTQMFVRDYMEEFAN